MVDATLAQAGRMGAPRAIALCQCFNGALEYQAGHWNTAEAALNESIKLYREMGAASGEALSWQRLGVLQTARGQLETAMNSFTEGTIAAERAVMRAHCQARLYASMTRNRLIANDLPAADQYLALGLEMSERHGNCATCNALLLPAATSLRIAQGALQQAEQFCRQLEEAAAQYASRMWVAMAKQTRGEILAAQNKPEEALASYEQAYEAYQAVGHDYEAARCLLAVADLHAGSYSSPDKPHDEQHDEQRVVAIRRQAETLLEQLGAL
jgi:predicted negative regulator of RcsB-dependent stress response